MDTEQRERLRELFDAAMDLGSSERPDFIERSCEGDPELRRTLDSLIDHSAETGSSFDRAVNQAVDLEGSIPTRLDLVGRTLGHYRIIEKIGEGGMGEVYRVADTRLGRDVAIKILPEAFTRDPERLARFEREARVLASLNHPNIATIHGVEESEGTRFLVLELIEGRTLREALEEGGMPLNSVIRLAAQVAAGLAKAHEAGIVHRDLKPENLMLTDDGFVKILDFGLAKATRGPDDGRQELKTVAGRIMGTVNYMSPEQARGAEVDHRSDQFSFGSVLFEMATGARAFAGDTDADTLVAIMREDPERPEDFDDTVPQPLRSIIARCLEKDPEERFETTREMARALRHLKALFWEIIESEMTGTGQPQASRNWIPALATAVTVVVLVVAVVWWRSRGGDGEFVASPGEVTASIAVLPLENLGPADEEYFADGMTEALITHLSKIEALKVISRTSVMQYKDSQRSLPEIARELGVETVLTGSVLHAGDRVRISTQLTEAESDRNIWAESYEKDLSDVLALQSQVARSVAGAVSVKVEPAVEARLATGRVVDPEAQKAFLRGRARMTADWEGGIATRNLFRGAIGQFQRAVEIEPEWAEAHAELAAAYREFANLGGPDIQREFYPKAKAAALRALELDDTVAQAHAELGFVQLLHEWDWAAAERSFQRFVELNPNGSPWPFANFLRRAGRYDEAVEQYTRARERDPTTPLISRQLGEVYMCTGRVEEAEAEARRLIEAFPDMTHGRKLLGTTLLYAGRYEEAAEALGEVQDEVFAARPWLAERFPIALAKAGRVEDARQVLRELEESGFDWFPGLYWVLGEEEKAMAQIEAAFAVHRDILLTIRCTSEFESFLENPRFREIIDAIGFPN